MNNADKPAYPTHDEAEGGIYTVDAGLTKREYFAAMAMQGLLSNAYWASTNSLGIDHENCANHAIKLADELLKQLEK